MFDETSKHVHSSTSMDAVFKTNNVYDVICYKDIFSVALKLFLLKSFSISCFFFGQVLIHRARDRVAEQMSISTNNLLL